MAKVYVADVSSLSFYGYSWDSFVSLAEAMAYVAQEIEDGMGERYEISTHPEGEGNNIEVDARYSSFVEGE